MLHLIDWKFSAKEERKTFAAMRSAQYSFPSLLVDMIHFLIQMKYCNVSFKFKDGKKRMRLLVNIT